MADVAVCSTPDSSGACKELKLGFRARLRGERDPKDDVAAGEGAKPPAVSFVKLFRFMTRREKLLMALGCVAAAVHGALLPLWTVFLGGVAQRFGQADQGTSSDVVSRIGNFSKWFLASAGLHL
jgi:hypothetical protein